MTGLEILKQKYNFRVFLFMLIGIFSITGLWINGFYYDKLTMIYSEPFAWWTRFFFQIGTIYGFGFTGINMEKINQIKEMEPQKTTH